jgi:hypothetical protein
MPLQISHEDADYGFFVACDVLSRTSSVDYYRKYWVLMGGFAMANNPAQDTALATSGAAGCQIIIVHKGPGRGALGHYAGHDDPHWIVRGVSQMIRALGGHPIAEVVFAAGVIGEDAVQQKYQDTILDWVRIVCPGAQVRWPAGGPWGAAYYLPRTEEIALFESQLDGGGWDGGGDLDAQSGVTIYDYWFTAAPPAQPARPRRPSSPLPRTSPPGTRPRKDSL